MKLLGTVKSFDQSTGFGFIKPENGSDELRFENSAVQWGKSASHVDQRLSYEIGTAQDGKTCAVNLQSI
jgi:cold shock CspA family protein